TLLDVISGKVQPTAGRVIFGRNTDLVGRRENQIASLGVGRKFQTPSIFANLTVRENLELALVRTSKGVLATLRSRLTGEQGDRVQATLESIGLSAEADLRAGGLSHGQKQWLEIGMVMVPDSGVVCLMGRNGVGKTTLLKSIMGLLPVRAGHITFDGADLGGLRPEERAARGIGYVPQGREIFPNLSVAENLRIGLLGRPR